MLPAPAAHGRRERREVDVPQFGIGQVDLVVVATADRRPVAGEMLRTGDDALGRPSRSPWNPRTWAAATAAPSTGSSPAPSMMRPQRGSRAMSTIGANVQWIPTARASRAATAWPRSMISGSQEAAMAIGTGKIVRRPWITSNPNKAGIAVPVALDDQPLQAIGLGRIGHEQQRAHPAPGRSRFDLRRLLGRLRRCRAALLRRPAIRRSRSTASVARPSRPASCRPGASRRVRESRPRPAVLRAVGAGSDRPWLGPPVASATIRSWTPKWRCQWVPRSNGYRGRGRQSNGFRVSGYRAPAAVATRW